jgi:acyl-CoA dehydrogenase
MITLSPRAAALKAQLLSFMEKHIYPNEAVFEEQHNAQASRWAVPQIMEDLKLKAQKEGLWNVRTPRAWR